MDAKLQAFLDQLKKSSNPNVAEFINEFLGMAGQPVNLNVMRVVYVPMTDTLPARVRVYSERFNQVITLSWHDEKFDKCNDMVERAVLELKERGFNVVAVGTGKGCMYVMSNTFKPFKP